MFPRPLASRNTFCTPVGVVLVKLNMQTLNPKLMILGLELRLLVTPSGFIDVSLDYSHHIDLQLPFFILFVLLFFLFRRGSVTAAYAQLFVFTERPIMCNFLL